MVLAAPGINDSLGFCIGALNSAGYHPSEIHFSQDSLPVYPMLPNGKHAVPEGGTEWLSSEEAVKRGLISETQARSWIINAENS